MSHNIYLKISEAPMSNRLVNLYLYGNSFFRRSSHVVKMPKFSKISQTEKKILNETLRHVTYLKNCIFFEVSC